jgi:hypothetical protein
MNYIGLSLISEQPISYWREQSPNYVGYRITLLTYWPDIRHPRSFSWHPTQNYVKKTGQDNLNRAARRGHPEKDCPERATRIEQQWRDGQNRTVRTEQLKQNRIFRTERPEQYIRKRTVWKGRQGQDSQESRVRKGRPGKDSQDRKVSLAQDCQDRTAKAS